MNDAAAPTRQGRRTRVSRVALISGSLLLAALLIAFDWNWLQGPVERRVSGATGRSFAINGDLEVDLGSTVIIKATGLTLANAAWSEHPEMARADLLRLEVPFWPLVRGERLLRRVDVVRPRLRLERNSAGEANWRFDERDAEGDPWRFGELRVHDGELRLSDEPLDTDLKLRVDSIPVSETTDTTRLLGQGSGRYRGHDFHLEGRADSPTVLFVRGDESYNIDIKARAGATRARVWGALPVPLDFSRFTVRSRLAGDDLEDVYHLLGLAMPATPPYEISGVLERKGRVVSLTRMQGRLGDSDVAGDVTVDASGKKPVLRADLTSQRLDFDDLAGFIGAAPSIKPGETASSEQRALAAKRAERTRLFPDHPYDLRKLASMNAAVHLHARQVDAGKWPIDTFATRLQLQDSVLRLDELDIGFAGGTISGAVRLDARREPIDTAADLAVRGVDLERVWPNMDPPNVGRVSADIDLHGRGNSVAGMLATADGTVGAAMGQGRFSNLLLELVGLDFAEALKFLIGKDKTVKLRCAFGNFAVTDGRAKADTLVFDTSDTVIFGSGSVNLQDESLALELRPEPKDVSPLTLRGPLEIRGHVQGSRVPPAAETFARPRRGRRCALRHRPAGGPARLDRDRPR
jgi:AsmA family protein